MRISSFDYKGKSRVAVEHGPDERLCGLLCTQLVPTRGLRTFVPAKMFDSREVKGLRRLYYLFRFKVGL